ncbi:hypothetical protein GCM10008995_20660 [Halobellus salinus]|uniref:Uncharacterized protein n=1 Tax=Halobellus salinus TaxID=931585 RepID=A0A830EC26_9EURY|nr:hypothetical protein [Halobellus salinus]GGJ10675.1 hypothetical protein GCM10008995_20660 [Halobellus salinus]SMP10179.1 hypothetical protein SAMN06265347_103164 [Halobellus salinus]
MAAVSLRSRVDIHTLLHGAIVANTLVLLAVAYMLFGGVTAPEPRYVVYGLLWVFIGLITVWKTAPATTDDRTRRRAAAAAVGYFAALAVAGGLLTFPETGAGATWGIRLVPLPPGWGPAPVLTTPYVVVGLVPARVVGYVGLSYLVYATFIDAAGSAVSGLFGLLSCVSCTWPVVASVATGVVGGGSAVATAALGFSYDLSTAVFLVTVGLLYWRPSVGGD